MKNLDEKVVEGFYNLFARVVGQLDSSKDEVLHPENTNDVPFIELTWNLNTAEDQDRLICQIIQPQMAELQLGLTSRSKRVREASEAVWSQAKAACQVIIEKPEDYDLQSFFDSLLSRITAPADAETTKAFFRKVLAAAFSNDVPKSAA